LAVTLAIKIGSNFSHGTLDVGILMSGIRSNHESPSMVVVGTAA
jgi:hypothetical protein